MAQPAENAAARAPSAGERPEGSPPSLPVDAQGSRDAGDPESRSDPGVLDGGEAEDSLIDGDRDTQPSELAEHAVGEAPPAVAELANACARYIAARYHVAVTALLDFEPETLSLLDQWVRDARADREARAEVIELVESAGGAYLGEVIRRALGATWVADSDRANWRLCLSGVYCAFNPLGMVREALLLQSDPEWHAHLELDPAEREFVEARLAALPPVESDEYYAPSTRFDVLSMVSEMLGDRMRASGFSGTRFTPDDYR